MITLRNIPYHYSDTHSDMRLNIVTRIGLLLLVPLCGAIVAFVFYYSFLTRTSHTTLFIHLATRQQMLSEQLQSWSHLLETGQSKNHDDLKNQVYQFGKALAILEAGGTYLTYELPPAPAELADEIALIKRHWSNVKPALLTIATLPAGDPRVRTAYNEVIPHLYQLTQACSNLTTVFENRNRKLRHNMLVTLASVTVVDLLLFVFGILLLRKHFRQQTQNQPPLNHETQIINHIPDAVFSTNLQGTVTSWNKSAEKLLGYTADEMLGEPVFNICPKEARAYFQQILNASPDKQTTCEVETRMHKRDCSPFNAQLFLSPLRDHENKLSGMICYVSDASTHRQTAKELKQRMIQQATVAELGQHALSNIDLGTLMDRTVGLVCGILGTEFCKILELQEDGETLLLRAGEGWDEGLVGTATVSCNENTQAGYTLKNRKPVIVQDLSTETRFSGPELLYDHNVVSGMSVIIHGSKQPYGILGVHSCTRHNFTKNDINFLRMVANILTQAIERRRAEETIHQNEERFRNLVETTTDWIWETDSNAIYTYASPQVRKVLGYAPEEIIGKSPFDFMPPEEARRVTEIFKTIVAGQEPFTNLENQNLHKDGHLVVLETSGVPFFDNDGKLLGYRGIDRDITERKNAEQALRKSEEEWRLTFNSISDFVCLLDKNGRILRANKALAEYTGMRPEELIGKPCHEIYSCGNCSSDISQCDYIMSSKQPVTIELDEPGLRIPLSISTSPVLDENGEIIALVHIARDITDRKNYEDRLQYLANHDGLTGLPNRTLFLDRLNQELSRSRRYNYNLAVLFLDLDRFKIINDSLGHEVGDELLQAVGDRLLSCVRESDTVARLGGDEFVIILSDIQHEKAAAITAKKVIDAIAEPFILTNHEYFVTTSIGISMFPTDGEDANTLIKNADVAMYRAKEQGKNNYQLYSPAMNARAIERLALENSLRHALEREEFFLHYQPKVSLTTGKITGMEVLLRWQHPQQGLIPPGKFISILEENGLIGVVGEWILRTACQQNKQWQQAGFEPLRLAINLSARQFREQNLTGAILNVLLKTGLDSQWLELEITESLLMEHKDMVIETLHQLHTNGVRLAIDDFGTGYSSLSYLKRFPIHTLKIDRTFIKDIPANGDDAAIAQAIIAMAHSLGLSVVAEGAETAEQIGFLLENRCDEVQGFYFSKPLSVDDFTQLLMENRQLDLAAHTPGPATVKNL